ncbi:hypothetical protein Tco_0825018, partial [Tanacetum coccineum]
SLPSDTKVARLLAIPTPLPSPLSPWSSPLPQIPSPPLPVSPPLLVSPLPLPASPTYPLGYRAAMIRLRAETPSTSHPLPLPPPIVLPHTRSSVAMMRDAAPSTYILAPRSGILPSETPPSGTPPLLRIPLPTPSLPFLFPSTDCILGVSEVTLPSQKRLCIALGLRFEVGKSLSAPTVRLTGGFRSDYGFVGTLDDEIRRDPKREVGYRITNTWDEMVEDMPRTPAATDVAALTLQSQQGPASGPARPKIPEEAENGTIKNHQINTNHNNRPTTSVTDEQLKRLIDQGVTDALAARNADRSRNGKDCHDSGTGVRRQAPLARECIYPDFMKYKPLYFKGTEGVVELTQWFERMEIMFRISNCSVENQIKFSTCNLLGRALTW